MFAIYPDIEKNTVKEHAVVFVEDAELAKLIAAWLESDRGLPHSAYLVLPSWPDPQLVNNLNGCGPDVFFSVRCGRSASDAAHWLRPRLKQAGFVDRIGDSLRPVGIISDSGK